MRIVGSVALCGALCVWHVAVGASAGSADADGVTAAPTVDDEIIVRGRIGELRQKMWLAEEAVYARFNEINSDDRLDVHCYWRPRPASRLTERACLSNSWREQDANFGQATARAMQGEYGANPQQYRGQQLDMQRKLNQEMLRLAAADEQLAETVWRLARAQLALAGETGVPIAWTVSQAVTAGDEGLPFEAARMFEVKVGREPWRHRLQNATFTLGQVTGQIRKLAVECDQGRHARLDYEAGKDWTLPREWSGCTLQVGAKPETTFALYEFE